jgi:hypothetical protein
VPKVQQVLKVIPERKEIRAHKVLKVQKVILERKVLKET